MKIRNLIWLLLICVAALGSTPVFAQSTCDNFDEKPTHFQALYQQARKLGTEICLSFGQNIPPELDQQFVEFARAAGESAAAAFASTEFSEQMNIQMQHFAALAEAGINKGKLPSFITPEDLQSEKDAVFFRFNDWNTEGHAVLDDPGCEQSGGASCQALFDSLRTAIEQYKKPFSSRSGEDLSKRAQELMAEWDRYFEQARSQTLLDAVLTTAMAQDHLAQSRLVGPMEKQWFALHPSIVIENVSDAADGDELAEALAIEWIGVNWWDADSSPIKYPFGVSLVSVYSDRVDVEEVGHGLMFHFGNSMSIGITDHDGDTGVAVTVDVLSLMARKKQHWESYKSELEGIIENEKKQLQN
jgi:hypothetical protein